MVGCCVRHSLALVPLSVGVTMGLGTFTTYIIATATKHADPLMPSISETGIKSPEKFIFSQVLNMAAALSVWTFVLRYKMLHEIWESTSHTGLRRLTSLNMILGTVASFGLSMVGNFQFDTALIAHLVGALMVFLLGNVYCFLEAYLTFKMSPQYTGVSLAWIRLALAVVATISFVITVGGTMMEDQYLDLFSDNLDQRIHWTSETTGYAVHVTSSMAEWVMGVCFVGFFFTYVPDFSRARARLRVALPDLNGSDVENLSTFRSHHHPEEVTTKPGSEKSHLFNLSQS